MMSEEALEARRAWQRKWAKENPEKVRAQQERYWQRKAEKMGLTQQSAGKEGGNG